MLSFSEASPENIFIIRTKIIDWRWYAYRISIKSLKAINIPYPTLVFCLFHLILHLKVHTNSLKCVKLFSFSSVWFPEFVKIDIFAFCLKKGNSLGFLSNAMSSMLLTAKSSRFYVPDAWVAWILKKDFQLGGGFLSCSWQIPGLAANSIIFCILFVKNHWFAWS